MTILIPAYEPDNRLLSLIEKLKEARFNKIVVIDDGSGEAYRKIFDAARQAGCTVLRHATNLGKGRALKTGFNYLKDTGEREGIVCADSDGQHLPSDIKRIAEAVDSHPNEIVLGCRHFTGDVPLRSRLGNSATRLVYKLTTGIRIFDTQTGLRGFSAPMLDWLCQLPGERFEYEMNMLLQAEGDGYALHEVPIETVYLEENKSSHFRPIADSVKVYAPILKFCSSSLLSALLDFLLLFVLQALSGSLLFSVVGARLGSSICNYLMNRRFVFGKRKQTNGASTSAVQYFSLAVGILIMNYVLIDVFNNVLNIPLFIAKLLTEITLFVISYWVQRNVIFKSNKGSKVSTTSKVS
ncbi:bifunctional glycosyltransferase family 2/GtrA family protein [Paenibacillus pinistramenti]|uniref:bifunctional glycosyltransferase family 2/GtrA family protein n=1 Tax=Paenibacillus pinistramenti TaxID=1768003 RepID=UPI0011093205|nr:bifunctional glycosyltransferase family 2/GtrA family protein [Paenibacillus pinistramenti]